MRKTEPRTLPGFMELLPSEQILFDDMKQKIEKSYQKFGFLPIDTPIIEYAEVLLAKAGGETEKQIYRFEKGDTDLALRFDLTVPLAKYVAKNYGNLSFPFRRYQIGKVYRGEKAQKGRYREFYQCDIDIIGDETLDIINDAELPAVIYSTFRTLGFENFTIKINNRKILNGLFEGIGQKDKSVEILRIIDKIDKIGEQAVRKEIAELGVGEKIVNTIIDFIRIDGSADEKIEKLEQEEIEITGRIRDANIELVIQGIDECYRRIHNNYDDIQLLGKWINEMRVELKKKVLIKQDKELKNTEIYSYMHDLLGPDMIEIFDNKKE